MSTERPTPAPSRDASVSVVMPVRNESDYIGKSLRAVLAQDCGAERVEVLVADGCSTDGTREIVQDFARRFPSVRLVDNPGRIVATGLNRVIAEARGEIIVRVDGHCEIAPDYVRRCIAHLRSGEAEGVGGPLETVGETAVARVIARAMSSWFGVGGAPFRVRTKGTMLVDTVAFPAYTREVMERAGPFDEELVRNQDDEYNYRLREMGARVLLAEDVRSRYYSRSSLKALWKQYLQYGYWKVRVMQKHPRQMRLRQFVPPLFVAGLLLAALIAPFSEVGRYLLAGLTGAYAGASLLASALVAARGLEPAMALLPLVFAVMHFAYGLGFLGGLVAFVHRWGDRQTRASAGMSVEQTGA